ncbi:hypothetical protein FNF27_06130 [Cafeteria roenbergensis]|uniref:EGF-like domain-containing protein n=1 Tax=Cafeteria roenbergensis TaxID=33653 RepID=A0A5A8E2R0_CAFRO|nr:hypothetical protein FNF27_06130 [Cafeteria roenbergensis]
MRALLAGLVLACSIMTAAAVANGPDLTATAAAASPFEVVEGTDLSFDVVARVIESLVDDDGVTDAADMTLQLSVNNGADNSVVATSVFDVSGCQGTYSAGCVVTGAASGATPEGSADLFEFVLTVTDGDSVQGGTTFFIALQSSISATKDNLDVTIGGVFAESGTRDFTYDLSTICTSTGEDDDVTVEATINGISGSQGGACTGVSPAAAQSTSPEISCTFTGAGVVSVSVTCTHEWDSFADAPATVTGTWTITANGAPVVGATGSFAYSENGGARALGSDVVFSITDADTDMTKAVVAIDTCATGKETLGVADAFPASLTSALTDDGCTITLTPADDAASASVADFEYGLGNVTFTHTSDDPDATSGVGLTVTVTDSCVGDATGPAGCFLEGTASVSFNVTSIDDALGIMVESEANNASAFSAATTTLKISEHPAADACLQTSSDSDLVITIEDFDVASSSGDLSASATDLGMTIIEGGLDTADLEIFKLVPTDVTAASTSQMGSTLVAGAATSIMYRTYKVCVAAVDTETVNGATRSSLSTIDRENLAPNKFANMTSDGKLPLTLSASSPNGANARNFTIWYQVVDTADEAPHFFPPSAGTAAITGRRTGTVGIVNQRSFYRSSLKASFTLKTANLESATGNILTDAPTYNYYDSSVDAELVQNVTLPPLDFVHGIRNEFAIPISSIAVNPTVAASSARPRFSIELMGEVTFESDPASTGSLSGATVEANTTSTLSELFPDNADFGFKFTQNWTHLVFAGKPTYDSAYDLTNFSTARTSPTAKRLHFRIHAKHPTDDSLESIRNMYLDIEVRGCMDVRGSWTNGTSFLNKNVTLDELPVATNLAQYDSANVSWKNPNGNFNDDATIPSLCTFPPRAVPAGEAATMVVSGARSETSAAALETALGSSPTDAEVESARGFVAVDVPTGATTAEVAIEVAGVTEDVAVAVAPPKEGAIVDTDLAVKLGPCGQQFEKPLEVCVFVGKALTDRFFTMYHAPAVNCDDLSLGYASFEETTGNVYNSRTGKLCGKVSSFSIVAGVSLPVPTYSQLDGRFMVAGGGCPGDCSGKGYCRAYAKCECFEGFGGYDCSQRVCPFGDGWASNSEVPRASAECSGLGDCDRATGECQCFGGFEGPACDRVACENGCSGHGRCRYINELPNALSYSNWDAARIQTCACDPGYTGPDCSQRMCSFGDDPQTHCGGGANKKQTVTLALPISDVDALAGSYPTAPGGFAGTTNAWETEYASLALGWQSSNGEQFFTSPVHNLLATKTGAAASSADLKTALATVFQALPNYVADDAMVITDASTAKSRAVTLELAGHQNAGTLTEAFCPDTYGCPFPGCRPRYQQPRMTASFVASTDVVPAEPFVIKPPGGVDGVAIKVTIATATYKTAADTTTIAAQTCPITVSGATMTEGACTTTMAARPVPSKNFETKPVHVGAGLRLKFTTKTPAAGDYYFYYIVGSCTAVEVRPAGESRKSLECSGRGACDRTSGTCECFEGFQGYNCAARSIIL